MKNGTAKFLVSFEQRFLQIDSLDFGRLQILLQNFKNGVVFTFFIFNLTISLNLLWKEKGIRLKLSNLSKKVNLGYTG